MTDTPKPAPATPAATPMAGKHLPRVSTDGRLSCSCGFTIGTIDTSANVRKVTEVCAYLFAGHVAALQPAAAQPQRESEQLREALKSSMVALDDWLNIHAPDLCDEQRVKEAHQRVNERGTIHYIGTVQDRNRAALSPRSEQLEQALRTYGRHRFGCAADPVKPFDVAGRCDCGFEAALSPQTDSKEPR